MPRDTLLRLSRLPQLSNLLGFRHPLRRILLLHGPAAAWKFGLLRFYRRGQFLLLHRRPLGCLQLTLRTWGIRFYRFLPGLRLV